MISFGVAPACLGYAVGMTSLIDQLVLLYFVACGISRLARYNVTAEAMSAETGKVTYFEGTPIPTSVLLVLLLLALTGAGRIGDALPFGSLSIRGAVLHPFVLAFGLSGSLMISKTLRILVRTAVGLCRDDQWGRGDDAGGVVDVADGVVGAAVAVGHHQAAGGECLASAGVAVIKGLGGRRADGVVGRAGDHGRRAEDVVPL